MVVALVVLVIVIVVAVFKRAKNERGRRMRSTLHRTFSLTEHKAESER